jgi:hypothetical protein
METTSTGDAARTRMRTCLRPGLPDVYFIYDILLVSSYDPRHHLNPAQNAINAK